jgi:hypothetical protein
MKASGYPCSAQPGTNTILARVAVISVVFSHFSSYRLLETFPPRADYWSERVTGRRTKFLLRIRIKLRPVTTDRWKGPRRASLITMGTGQSLVRSTLAGKRACPGLTGLRPGANCKRVSLLLKLQLGRNTEHQRSACVQEL